jgi:hypothetical protein
VILNAKEQRGGGAEEKKINLLKGKLYKEDHGIESNQQAQFFISNGSVWVSDGLRRYPVFPAGS